MRLVKLWARDFMWMVVVIAVASIYGELGGPFVIGFAVGLAMAVSEVRHQG